MSSFYSESTLLAVIILSIVLIAITGLLYGIRRHLRELSIEKDPTSVEPSFYESTIKPVTSAWNPTIATLAIGTLIMLVLAGFGYKYGMDEVGVQQGYSPEQPINFSHKIHAGQYEIDCKYCHSTVEKSKSASIPSLNTCMNCHKYVQAKDKYAGKISPEIQKIYDAIGWDVSTASYSRPQNPIRWVRIHNLPDLAYFNHSQHVVVGKVECQTCHGPIEEMEKVYQYSSLQMGWCIDCHRERGIDLKDNKYYEDIHERVKKDKDWKGYMTVAENGGLECSKCHY